MRKNIRYVLMLVGLVVISLMIMDFNNRISELGRLADQRDQAAEQVSQLSATNAQLQTQMAYATSEDAVLEQAYGQERVIRPGDVLVVPIPSGNATPEPTPEIIVAPIVYENWEYWYALFFGERP